MVIGSSTYAIVELGYNADFLGFLYFGDLPACAPNLIRQLNNFFTLRSLNIQNKVFKFQISISLLSHPKSSQVTYLSYVSHNVVTPKAVHVESVGNKLAPLLYHNPPTLKQVPTVSLFQGYLGC